MTNAGFIKNFTMKDIQFWINARLALAEKRLEHYVPLIVWVLVFLTLLFIPLKIISLGYMPPDDAPRHVAKAISGKSWQEILVMRPDITLDQHIGWHTILASLYKSLDWSADSLVLFSVLSLNLLFWLAILIGFRRAEAIIFAALFCMLSLQGILYRTMLGRPFILSMTAMIVLLLVWTNRNRITLLRAAGTVVLLTVTIWIHGTCWYLYLLPIAAFFLAGYIRQGVALIGCWLLGSLGGALLTGHPVTFLVEQIRLIGLAMGDARTLTRMLVTEFQPSDGSVGFVLVILFMILIQRDLNRNWEEMTFRNPIFITGVMGWILGFQVFRFWLDWGAPALLLWLIFQFQNIFVWKVGFQSLRRLAVTAVGCLALFFSVAADTHSRWTDNLTVIYMDAGDKQLAGWLPGKGGIIYSSDMSIFYQTFYKNPHESWRYILGFEPGLMPAEDLKIYRSIQMRYLDAAYDPWVKKMRPEDRLMIRGTSGVRPSIPGLEWAYGIHHTWIGRLPQEKKEGSGKGQDSNPANPPGEKPLSPGTVRM